MRHSNARIIITTLVSILTVASNNAVSSETQYEAGFNCNKAKSEIEKTICNDATLADLDKRLNYYYQKLILSIPESETGLFRRAQRAWLISRDVVCAASKSSIDCVKDAYDQRIFLLDSWNTEIMHHTFKEVYILEKNPSMIPPVEIPEESWRSRERYRLVEDFNNDGIDDVALSYETSMFGNAGGHFFLYLGMRDGTYKEIGSFFAHPLAINLEKTTEGESVISTYGRLNSVSGGIVERRVTDAGIFIVDSKFIHPGDEKVPEDQKQYLDLFGNAARMKAEISTTKENVITWKPL